MGEKLVLQIDKQLEESERSSSTAQSLFHRVAGKSASVEQVLGLADCIASMRRALTPEIVSKFKELQGSPIGFVTDKDKDGGYDDVVLRDVMLEAILRGFAPINNEFNVIAGRFYPAKNGLERKVREFPGLSDLKITLGVPNDVGEGALVAATATWKMNGAEQRLECLKTEALDARIHVRIKFSDLLRALGNEVYLFTYKLSDHEDVTRSYCYRIKATTRVPEHLARNYFSPPLYLTLRRWIQDVKPDWIHIHHNTGFTATVALACRGAVPVLQTVHDHRIVGPTGKGRTSDGNMCARTYGYECHRRGCISWRDYLVDGLARRFKTLILRNIPVTFLAPSADLKKKMEACGFHVHLLKHFLDITKYPSTPADSSHNRLLFVGRLHIGKGVAILLRSFRRVREAIPTATLECVGNGDEGSRFRMLAHDLGLGESVRFHGHVPHDEVRQFYEGANVVVLPVPWIENSPLVIMEAMASRTMPVVASRIGGIPEMVADGESGLLCTPGDEDDLTEKILTLLQNKERAEDMGRRGREMAAQAYSYGPSTLCTIMKRKHHESN